MFISRIKELRIKRRLSQEELSILAKCSQMYISQLERGKKFPTLTLIENIAKALDCCARDVYSYKCDSYEHCTNPSKKILNCLPDE